MKRKRPTNEDQPNSKSTLLDNSATTSSGTDISLLQARWKKAKRRFRVHQALLKLRQKIQVFRPSVFISYAWEAADNKNKIIVIEQDLKDAGLFVWFDIHHNQAGTSIVGFTEEIMRLAYILEMVTEYENRCDKVVVSQTKEVMNRYLSKKGVLGEYELPKIEE
jgi:hypothetical protein